MIIKAFMISIVPLITIIFLLIKLLPVDLWTINVYMKECNEAIIIIFTQDDYKSLYGKILIHTNKGDYLFCTEFYVKYIINQQCIKDFLEHNSWQSMIKDNNLDLTLIKNKIIENYGIYISKLESTYNSYLLTDNEISRAKYKAIDVLQTLLKNMTISADVKQALYLNNFFLKVLNGIDFVSYIKTNDFQSKDYFLLQEIFEHNLKEFIQNLEVSAENVKLTWFAYTFDILRSAASAFIIIRSAEDYKIHVVRKVYIIIANISSFFIPFTINHNISEPPSFIKRVILTSSNRTVNFFANEILLYIRYFLETVSNGTREAIREESKKQQNLFFMKITKKVITILGMFIGYVFKYR